MIFLVQFDGIFAQFDGTVSPILSVKQLLVSICSDVFEKRLCNEIKNTKNPNYINLKQKVYAPISTYGSLRKCVDSCFYNNGAIKNHVPAKLFRKLASIYS